MYIVFQREKFTKWICLCRYNAQPFTLMLTSPKKRERKREREKNGSFERYSQDVSIDDNSSRFDFARNLRLFHHSEPAPLMPRNIPTIAPLSRPIMSQPAQSSKRKRWRSIDRSIRSPSSPNTIALITRRNQRWINKVYSFFSCFHLSYFKWHS